MSSPPSNRAHYYTSDGYPDKMATTMKPYGTQMPIKTEAQQPASAKPFFSLRVGAISVAVWANERETQYGVKTFFSFSAKRSYKSGDEWKTTDNFDADDVPELMLALNEAYRAVKLRDPSQK